MKQAFQLCGIFALVFAGSISCADQHRAVRTDLNGQDSAGLQLQLLTEDTLTIVDAQNQPVPNATVLLGVEPGNPFPGNVITTGHNGKANLPADWTGALPITVQAQGFVTTTIPALTPGERVIRISQQEGSALLEVQGMTKDYGRIITDGKVDFALVIPTLQRADILNFDISTVVSPQFDTITVVGRKVELPSNIALPSQRETYIVPINLNKPQYRVFPRNPGQHRIAATHGQFPLQKVVNEVRAGKGVFDVINYFNFMQGGHKDVSVSANVSGIDVSVNQIPFNKTFSVQAPNFASNQLMLGLALNEQNGALMPTDLKRIMPTQNMPMKTPSTGGTHFLSVLMEDSNAMTSWFFHGLEPLMELHKSFSKGLPRILKSQDFSRLSITMVESANGASPQFLGLVEKPQINGQIMTLQAPVAQAGLMPAGTYVVLVEIETFGSGDLKTERRTRIWEIMSPSWLAQIDLPKVQFARSPDRKYRWETMFLAKPTGAAMESRTDDVIDLNSVTHATRSALDI